MNEICLSCRKHTKCGRAKHETIGCGYYVPQTNEEWLKQCTTEQLAEWINNIVDDGIIKAWMIKNNCCGDYLESVKWWLKQPHTIKE